MGLDMYLTGRIYVGADYEHRAITGTVAIKAKGEEIKLPPFNTLSEIVYSVAYWRKANAIHRWFVDNVQKGVDDCKEYYVPLEALQDLVNICKDVANVLNKCPITSNGTFDIHRLSNKDKATLEQLSPQGGFFFGSIDIDTYYKQDIEDTISLIQATLEKYPEMDYYYKSSW